MPGLGYKTYPITRDIRVPTNSLIDHVMQDDGIRTMILEGLGVPYGQQKRLPSLILWDKRGLDIYNEELSKVKEYYIHEEEIEILTKHSESIVERIANGSIIVELGSGSLEKTRILLKALDEKRVNIQYYALDLLKCELEKTLSRLDTYKNVDTVGLWGSYKDGMEFIKSLPPSKPKIILWLGCSIGNFTQSEAENFLENYNTCLTAQDFWLIGLERRNSVQGILTAYDDPAGIQAKFCLNGLNHVNSILQQDFLKVSNFEYYIRFNEEIGRVESHFKSLVQQDLIYKIPNGEDSKMIHLEKNELIQFAYACKYSLQECQALFENVGMAKTAHWTSRSERYDIHMVQVGFLNENKQIS